MSQRDLTTHEQDVYKSMYKSIFNEHAKPRLALATIRRKGSYQTLRKRKKKEVSEELRSRGAFNFNVANYRDYLVDRKSNRIMYDFCANKTKQRLRYPERGDFLAPLESPYAIGTKRSSLEQDYYECLNQHKVEILSVKKTLIEEFTETGVDTHDP